eukprot:127213-Chlamydomonas_euryale.AAC.1
MARETRMAREARMAYVTRLTPTQTPGLPQRTPSLSQLTLGRPSQALGRPARRRASHAAVHRRGHARCGIMPGLPPRVCTLLTSRTMTTAVVGREGTAAAAAAVRGAAAAAAVAARKATAGRGWQAPAPAARPPPCGLGRSVHARGSRVSREASGGRADAAGAAGRAHRGRCLRRGS